MQSHSRGSPMVAEPKKLTNWGTKNMSSTKTFGRQTKSLSPATEDKLKPHYYPYLAEEAYNKEEAEMSGVWQWAKRPQNGG